MWTIQTAPTSCIYYSDKEHRHRSASRSSIRHYIYHHHHKCKVEKVAGACRYQSQGAAAHQKQQEHAYCRAGQPATRAPARKRDCKLDMYLAISITNLWIIVSFKQSTVKHLPAVVMRLCADAGKNWNLDWIQ